MPTCSVVVPSVSCMLSICSPLLVSPLHLHSLCAKLPPNIEPLMNWAAPNHSGILGYISVILSFSGLFLIMSVFVLFIRVCHPISHSNLYLLSSDLWERHVPASRLLRLTTHSSCVRDQQARWAHLCHTGRAGLFCNSHTNISKLGKFSWAIVSK